MTALSAYNSSATPAIPLTNDASAIPQSGICSGPPNMLLYEMRTAGTIHVTTQDQKITLRLFMILPW